MVGLYTHSYYITAPLVWASLRLAPVVFHLLFHHGNKQFIIISLHTVILNSIVLCWLVYMLFVVSFDDIKFLME